MLVLIEGYKNIRKITFSIYKAIYFMVALFTFSIFKINILNTKFFI